MRELGGAAIKATHRSPSLRSPEGVGGATMDTTHRRPSLRSPEGLRRAASIVALVALVFPSMAHAAGKEGVKHQLTPKKAIAIARHDRKVVDELRRYPKAKPKAEFKKDEKAWHATWSLRGDNLVQAVVVDKTGKVAHSYTGYQVEWMMARGTPGLFGHKLNSVVVWIPMCLIFFAGLFDWRRPWRGVNLDIAMLLAFGVSHYVFNRGDIGLSVPLVYPVLLYLMARMLWIGFRGAGDGIRPRFPVKWMAIAAIFFVVFRAGLNIQDSSVIDVGYSGVIGADRTTHLKPIYGTFPHDNKYGDTYGPVAYYTYVPFELAWPWHGHWDKLPAAHAAAIFFDLLTILGLILLGRRLRPGRAGRDLGIVFAFAWTAYPYTAFALSSNTNDALVAASVVGILLVASRPLARGAMVAIAAATKLAPILLAPLFANLRPLRPRQLALYALGFTAVTAAVMAPTLVDPGIRTFYDRTLGFQSSRGSPFSIWGQDHSLETLQTAVKLAAVALAVFVAFFPKRRTLAQSAALAAAVIIAAQLTVEHWFYLYIPWFFPLILVALTAARPAGVQDDEPELRVIKTKREPASGPALSSPPVPVS
jgi:glycosyl transferase family 87